MNTKSKNTSNTVSWRTRSYWLNKGFSEREIDAILNFDLKRYDQSECERLFGDRSELVYQERQKCLKRQPRCSPFSREFWMLKKGYTAEQADYKRNSMRPIRKEYWMEQGYTEDDAIIKAQETKQNNNKKGAKASASRPQNEVRRNNHRCLEYYIERGYSEIDAKQMLSEHQAWFSLEICVNKHGPILGYQIWLDRQTKWQQTLKNKSDEEVMDINRRKNALRLELFDDVNHAIEKLNSIRGMNLVKTWEEFDTIVKYKVQSDFFHTTTEYFYEMHVPKVQKEILNMDFQSFHQRYEHLFYSLPADLKAKSNWHRKTKKTLDGYLRSSLEIYFYDMFIKHNIDNGYQLRIDKRYPDSSFRFDFSLTSKTDGSIIYVEICPLILQPGYELYRDKMLKKQTLFKCELLATKEQVDHFIKDLI